MSAPTDIELQTQPTASTCVQTCLAMAMGVPVSKVIERFGSHAMDHDQLNIALRDCGIVHVPLAGPRLCVTGWHFAVVPSLNIRGGNHQVLIHLDMNDGKITVRDPSMLDRYSPNGSDLKSWGELIYFYPGGRLRF